MLFSGFVVGNDDLIFNCNEEGIGERYKGLFEINSDVFFWECVIEGDFLFLGFLYVFEDD